MNGDTSHDANNGQQTPPPLPVVNKGTSSRTKPTIIIVCAIAAAILFFGGILAAVSFPAVANAIMRANMTAMANRAKDIYATIVRINFEREPLGLGPIWPKSGEPMEYAEDMDISDMTFANSSDYFSVLCAWEHRTSSLAQYVIYSFDYSKCAGAGVPLKQEYGRLTAENNAWTIAANITDDMPDIIPFIVSRNVDPSSLIPREGDLRQQFLRPSKYMTPFGHHGFLFVRKGGKIYQATWRYASLDRLYQGASKEELQAIRDAFEKIKYLEP